MNPLRSAVEIDAPAQHVWEVLTDWGAFPAWNPFILRAEGQPVVGRRIRIRLRVGGRVLRLRPLIMRVDAPTPDSPGQLRWLATTGLPGIFDVDRRFLVEPLGPDRCRLEQYERGSGLLAPLLMAMLGKPILDGYHAHERALAARAEGRDLPAPAGTRGAHRRTSHPHRPPRGHFMSSTHRNRVGPPAWKRRISSHESFSHDSIDSLGYDWERVANPGIAPRFPLKIYLPRSTDDIVTAVRETRELGQRLVVRSKGHSSNNLVLAEGGSILLTEKLNGIVDVDEEGMTATVQAGAISANVDDELAKRSLGLPVIGDHNHITVGGFASVGGISPASHRFGLFVDTVQAIEYVTWEGEVRRASRTENTDELLAMLTGLGRHGVLSTLTLRLIRVDKYETVLKNDQKHYWSVDSFVQGAAHAIRNPGDAVMERGVWVELPVAGQMLRLGQFSAYHPTEQSLWAKARDLVSYNTLHRIGYVAGRLPDAADRALKMVGMSGVMFSPTYATMKNVEFFTDKILDSTEGDPTRMYIALAPLRAFEDLFHETRDLMARFREEHDCFTFVSVYVKSITSPYLAQGSDDQSFCELMFYCGISEGGLAESVQDQLVDAFDDICIAHEGFRYMHCRTSKDPARRERVDPNAYYVRALEAAAGSRVAMPPTQAGAPSEESGEKQTHAH